MANQEHLNILKQGVNIWNKWRKEHPEIQPDLSEEDLSNIEVADTFPVLLTVPMATVSPEDPWKFVGKVNLSKIDLKRANLRGANLNLVNLNGANLRGANLRGARLFQANLGKARLNGAHLLETLLSGAYLVEADLSGTNLSGAKLDGANLDRANLSGANLSRTNFMNANLSNCKIYGISAWDVQLEGADQKNLAITPPWQSTITVDNLNVAQFIYLLLNNKDIRTIIDTITSKVVLILGRFTDERKGLLDALRDELRKHDYSPILFDFEKPVNRDYTETVRTLAQLAHFIIADLTDPSSIPQELQAIVPDLEVPVHPLLLEGKKEHSMFVDFRKYHWVLPIYLYKDRESLIASLQDAIIEPAEKKSRELAIEKAKRLEKP